MTSEGTIEIDALFWREERWNIEFDALFWREERWNIEIDALFWREEWGSIEKIDALFWREEWGSIIRVNQVNTSMMSYSPIKLMFQYLVSIRSQVPSGSQTLKSEEIAYAK